MSSDTDEPKAKKQKTSNNRGSFMSAGIFYVRGFSGVFVLSAVFTVRGKEKE
jgi:hypothetical protein